MPAHRVVSLAQLEILIELMEANRDLAVGRVVNSGPHDKQLVKSRWEAIATRLNAVGVGATKTAFKWRDYWNERKYVLRKRAQNRQRHAQGTGGGPPMAGPWTAMDERILAILGKEAVFGLPHVRPPFDPVPEEPTRGPSPEMNNSPSILWPESPVPPLLPSPPPLPLPSPPLEALRSPQPQPLRTPPPQPLRSPPLPTRSNDRRSRIEPSAPRWMLELEQRRLESEERSSRALESIAATLVRVEELMRAVLDGQDA